MQDKNSLQREQKRLLSIFDNAKDDFNNNKIESAVADIKREISYQKSREWAKNLILMTILSRKIINVSISFPHG